MKEIHLEGGRLERKYLKLRKKMLKLGICGVDSLPKEEIHLERGR
jgi:hypothetical protein